MVAMIRRNRKPILIIAVMMLVAGALYFTGIGFGLPHFLHPDEENMIMPAVTMRDNKTFEAQNFTWPAHVPFKLNMFAFFVLERIVGLPSGVIYSEQRHLLLLAARMVTALVAMGMVPLGYLIGRRNNPRTGYVLAALVALLPVNVLHAHYATPDITLTLLMLVHILLGLRYHEKPSYLNLFFLCASASAAFATKYPGAFYYVCVAVSVVVCALTAMPGAGWGQRLLRVIKHGVFALFAAVVSLFAISPSLLLNPGKVLKWMLQQNEASRAYSYFENVVYYLREYLGYTGLVLLAALVFGAVVLVRKRAGFWRWTPLLYGVVFWLFLNISRLQKTHWGMPFYVSLLAVAAFGVDGFLTFAKSSAFFEKHKKWARPAVAACAGLSLLSLLAGNAATLAGLLWPDARELGVAYCAENGITRENAAYTTYSPLRVNIGPTVFEEVFVPEDGQYRLTRAYIKHVVLNPGSVPGEMAAVTESLRADYAKAHEITPPRRPKYSPVEVVNVVRSARYIAAVARAGMVGSRLEFYTVESHNLHAYPLGETIWFNEYDENATTYCYGGLQEAEEAGAWSDGMAVDFMFYLPDAAGDLELELTADPMVAPRYTYQTVEFYAGETLVETIVMTEPGTYTVAIPASCVQDGLLALRIGLPDAIAPARIANDNPDERVLALLFREMRINKK